MPEDKRTSKARQALAGGELSAFSIEAFCLRNSISRGLFYKERRAGRGPQTMNVGDRTLITREAEAEWKRKREAESDQASRPERNRRKRSSEAGVTAA